MLDKITCEITEVDEANKCMLVKYTAAGFDPAIASVPLPTEEEAQALGAYLLAYSPAITWDRETKPKATVTPNQTIEIDYAALKNPEPTAADELKELENALAARTVDTIPATTT